MATVILATACAGSSVKELVEARAPSDLSCDQEQVDVRQRARGEFAAVGCGRSAVYQCHLWDERCANLTLLAQNRAQMELRCRPEGMVVTELSPHIFRVEGCGQAMNYRCEMKNSLASCMAETGAR